MLITENQSINLGELKYGVPFDFNYSIENISNEDILIKNITVGCHACTTARMETNTIKASSSELLKVTFTPGSTGINNKSVTLNYKKFSLILKFKAVVNK